MPYAKSAKKIAEKKVSALKKIPYQSNRGARKRPIHKEAKGAPVQFRMPHQNNKAAFPFKSSPEKNTPMQMIAPWQGGGPNPMTSPGNLHFRGRRRPVQGPAGPGPGSGFGGWRDRMRSMWGGFRNRKAARMKQRSR